MIIDWQHHWLPEKMYLERGGDPNQYVRSTKQGKTSVFLYPAFYRIEDHLAWMDEGGVDVSVMTCPSGAATVAVAAYWNDQIGDVIRAHPKRFAALMPFNPLWGEEGFAELKRAREELGISGVSIQCQIEDRIPMDSRELWPFYEHMAKTGTPVFVHVSSAARGFEAVAADWESNICLVREFDLATAVCRVILGGVLDQFPSLTLVFAHLGGGIAALWERVERYVHYWGPKFWGWESTQSPLSRPVHDYLDLLYFDLAGFEGGMNAVKCALTTFSPKRLVFGTDFPPNFVNDGAGVRRYVQNIRNLGLSPEDTDAILGANAARLLRVR